MKIPLKDEFQEAGKGITALVAIVTLSGFGIAQCQPSGVSHSDIAKLAKWDREHRAEYIQRARDVYGNGNPTQLEALGRQMAMDE
jgi:hypothetical protein